MSGVIWVRTISPDAMARFTVSTNSRSCVSMRNETKCVPMNCETASRASGVMSLADLPHLTAIDLSFRSGNATSVFMSAAFTESMTQRNGGISSPSRRATQM